MSGLAKQFYTLLERGWQPVFAQARTHRRALEHALAGPCVLGRRTLSRTICALGRSQQDWSADYKIFSRSRVAQTFQSLRFLVWGPPKCRRVSGKRNLPYLLLPRADKRRSPSRLRG